MNSSLITILSIPSNLVLDKQKSSSIVRDFILLNQLNILPLKLMKSQTGNIHDIAIELNRANVFLFTIRNYFNSHVLRTIYHAIYDLSRIAILHKKSWRIMNFQTRERLSLKSIIQTEPYWETSVQKNL